jgi:hypothetical protein
VLHTFGVASSVSVRRLVQVLLVASWLAFVSRDNYKEGPRGPRQRCYPRGSELCVRHRLHLSLSLSLSLSLFWLFFLTRNLVAYHIIIRDRTSRFGRERSVCMSHICYQREVFFWPSGSGDGILCSRLLPLLCCVGLQAGCQGHMQRGSRLWVPSPSHARPCLAIKSMLAQWPCPELTASTTRPSRPPLVATDACLMP